MRPRPGTRDLSLLDSPYGLCWALACAGRFVGHRRHGHSLITQRVAANLYPRESKLTPRVGLPRLPSLTKPPPITEIVSSQ
jgi:hypothetical protein